MQGNKSIIKFSTLCAFVSGIITYLISINIETGWITVSSIWISNSFLLTVMGGVFASALVVFIIECKKYIDTKQEAETAIFFKAFIYTSS